MSMPENIYWTIRILSIMLGIAFDIFIIYMLFRFTGIIDTSKRGAKERNYSWKELLPGPTGRRARVERKHLKIMGPNYKRREVRVKVKKWFPFKLHKHIRR